MYLLILTEDHGLKSKSESGGYWYGIFYPLAKQLFE